MEREHSNPRLSAYPSVPVGRMSSDGPGLWEVAITGDLSSEKQDETISRLLEFPVGSSGVIYFDSCGGSVYAGLSLATLIRTRELKATALVMGECSSAALMPFAACRRRLVTAVSTLLFHPMRWQSEEDVRMEEAAEWARYFKQLETDLDQLLASLFPLDTDLLHKWTRPGRFVTGRELADAGLATLFDPFHGDRPFQTLKSNPD